MEDAPEDDRDIKLQKISADYVADFGRSLGPFLRKPDGQLRSRVRMGETVRLTLNLLDPFQELPQLLDPQLPQWLPLLAASYLEHLYTHARRRTKPSHVPSASPRAQLLEPLPVAICKILYTFAKIRGPSVVLRFLPVEARHLEPLLSALESAERRAARPSIIAVTDSSRAQAAAAEPSQREWTWEERYIVLLWLSHLLLAPFDLSTISSADPDDASLLPLPELKLPKDLPGITARLLPIGIKYLASPGKERDGARDLLVRIAMRRDMQQLGVLDVLVRWALASLRPRQDEMSEQPYFYIGILSFLGGVLKSSVNTSDLNTHLTSIFAATHALSTEQGPVLESIRAYAVARKMMIKVIRSVAVQILRRQPQDMAGTEVVESSISYLLECLADNDTPVRLAASKALSVITLKLDPDMAEQVVEAVLESLNRNVLVTRNNGDPNCRPTRDLGAVDPLEWHGLMLTLSNLLYRRSPPAHQLADIIHGLLLGLSFEKRSTSGGSIGTNVRDAACFGIWAVARRYTTQELLAVPIKSVVAARTHPDDASVLQVLATELVVTACLDSAGNIRRGASAALQELIGRHPDTVEKGIWVVQTVDYHAVALRSRAIHDVALKATRLSNQYGHALLRALLGWRGIGDADAAARRVAGASFGTLTSALAISEGTKPFEQFQTSVRMILQWLGTLQIRQVDERHGLLLCLAAVLDQLPGILEVGGDTITVLHDVVQSLVRDLGGILEDARDTNYRRPELISEAACRLIISSLPLFQFIIGATASVTNTHLRPGFEVVCPKSTDSLASLVSSIDTLGTTPEHVQTLLSTCGPVIEAGLGRAEKEAITAASEASLVLLAFSPRPERNRIIKHWADAVRHRPTSRTTHSDGYFFALTMAHPIAALSRETAEADDVAADALLTRWQADDNIDTRVAILKSLTQSIVLRDHPLGFLDILAEGLNDYTTNARGDVGSHVRLEALRATKIIWQNLESDSATRDHALQAGLSKLYLRVLRLAAEKLDRVRTEAHSVLAQTMLPDYAAGFTRLTFSSKSYFFSLLSLSTAETALQSNIATIASSDPSAWMAELLAGYVTSADTGNEDLVIASRAALTSFCDISPANLDAVCTALVSNLSTYQQQGQDRILVPTLEIVAFLCRVGVFQTCRSVNLRKLCLLVQKAGYKTGNVRKLEACIRVYGCVAGFEARYLAVDGDEGLSEKRMEGVLEAKKRLGALMSHPWPRVKSLVVDELWRLVCDTAAEDGTATKEMLKGVDWGRAEKGAIKTLISKLQLG